MKTGIELITEERQRQIDVEGWSAEHDDQHNRGELAIAAACYALMAASVFVGFQVLRGQAMIFIAGWWPWDKSWWKPTNPKRDLVKAGALICAELDRAIRLEKP